MKKILFTAAGFFMGTAILGSAAVAQNAPEQDADRLTVVELFTSQGCSSCPPADAALRALRDRPGMLTLSWAVDYWDRLGWEDTFANPHYSMRQAAYNKRFGRGGVYTPQMVFDGRFQSVGSNQNEVRDAIKDARSENRLTISPTFSSDGTTVTLNLPETNVPEDIAVVAVWYMGDATVEIGDGENSGRSLHYTNVVRLSDMLPDWDGSAISHTFAVKTGRDAGADHLAVLLQQGYYHGTIVGAARIALNAAPTAPAGR